LHTDQIHQVKFLTYYHAASLKKYKSELIFFGLHIPTEGGQAGITGSCSAGRLKFLSDRRSEPQLRQEPITYSNCLPQLRQVSVLNCLPHLEISGTVLAVLTPFVMPRPSIANPDIVPRMGPVITMPKRYDTAIRVPVI